MVVAIDGPAGTGKSSVAKAVAERTGFLYLNSGALYRAVTWAVLSRGIDPDDAVAIGNLAKNIEINVTPVGPAIGGERPGSALRSQAVDAAVSRVSSVIDVRTSVNDRLLALAQGNDVIAEGRDMATVVFPDADLKVYLDASIEARAERRYAEDQTGQTLEEIRDAIAERDRNDKNKEVGSLKVDPAALYINTSQLTLIQVCDIVMRSIPP